MKVTPLINNFTSGEWSPLLKGRSDLQQYQHSLVEAINVILLPYGGTMRIPGTHFVAEVKDSNKKTKLATFEFNVEQAYILEFGDQYLRFYMNEGQIESAGSPYEISTPFLEDDLFDLHFTQEADVMYITHPSYWPRKLTRTGHTSWTLSEMEVKKGPLLDKNTDSDSTIKPSADTGSGITLTASQDIFQPGHVNGSPWRIKDGYVKITAYTDSKHVTADVLYDGDLNTGSAKTDDWAEGAWSSYRGFPATVTFFEQRLWFGYSDYKPQTFWSSKVGKYENFGAGTADDDALIYTLASDEVNVIRWIFGGSSLFVGTSGGVWNVSSGTSSVPISPTNVMVTKETNYGCEPIHPVMMGNLLYFVQRSGKKLREYLYDYKVDSYLAFDSTLLAEHVLKPGVVEMAYQQNPYALLYCVRSDGEVSILTRNAGQQVLGWSRRVDSGIVESVACIPRSNGGDDEVWFLVKRTINGVTKRYIEYLEEFEFDEQEDAFFINSGLTYNGTPISSVSGLDHLEGETVSILGDGAVFPNQQVSSGSVSLSKSCSVIHVGLPYTSKITLPPLEAGSSLGTSQGKIQRIQKVSVLFHRSLGCEIGVDGKMDIVPFRTPGMPMDSAPELFSGRKYIHFPKGYGGLIEIVVTQEQPLPLTLLTIIPFLETYEN